MAANGAVSVAGEDNRNKMRTLPNTANRYGMAGPLGLIPVGGRHRRRRSFRRATLIGIVAAVFLLTATVALARRNQGGERALPATVTVTVRSGDTLWKMAHRYGDPGRYILERVDELANENGLPTSAVLQPGQHLRVPIRNEAHYTRVVAGI
ncbi:MAG: LysM domain-containing protein [Capsulimonadales bacterium]|nr:LysM domain-containing protein [Capsulimonadales bacterium]